MNAATLPTVSVIVPAFRRAERLHSCLSGLARQDYPAELLEVVVVDDGSPLPLAGAAEPFADRLRVRVHRQANAGPAVARNTGARLASGELLAFTDDDCQPGPGWVPALARAHRAQPRALLGGRVVNALPDHLYAEASQQLVTFLYSWYAAGDPSRFFASNNVAAPAEDFRSLDGFDASFPRPGGEDRELGERWARSGRPLLEVPDAVVRHAHHMGLQDFLRQHRNYGAGAYQVHRRRAASGGTFSVESPRFYLRLVTSPLGTAPLPRALAVSGLLVAAQAANAAGFAREWWRSRPPTARHWARTRR